MVSVSSGQSVAKGVDDAGQYVFDRGNTYHILGDGCGSGTEDSSDLAYALILGPLECVD